MTDPQFPLDLFSPEFKRNPFPTYKWMRENCPVYCHQAPYGARIWYITRYEDVAMVLKDNDRFTKAPPHRQIEESADLFQMINRNMLFADPPDHTRLRNLVSQAFTPRRVASLAPQIRSIARRLLARVQPAGRMDCIADFAFPLPVQVIMTLLGIPNQDQKKVTDWSKAIIAPGRHGINLKSRRQKIGAFVNYLEEMFAARFAHPQDDLVTALVQAEDRGDRLSPAELSSMVALLFVTGHETVVNQIGNGLLALLAHPDTLVKLRNQPGQIGQMVEELLRFEGPVETSTTRWARQDIELHGQKIQAGDVIRVVLSSANRDDRIFNRPEKLVVTRESSLHLAFGLGVHYCLGAPLARLEGRLALEALLRLPNLRLGVDMNDLEWHSGVIFRGLKRMPLIWDVAIG